MSAAGIWDDKSLSDVKLLAHRVCGLGVALRDLSQTDCPDPRAVEALFDQLEDLSRTGSMAASWSVPCDL